MSDAAITLLSTVVSICAPILSYFAVTALQRIAAARGVQIDQDNLKRLDQFLINGLNLAAAKAGGLARAGGMPRTKEAIIQETFDYVQKHGAETLDKLNARVSDPNVQEAIRARIETMIADPTKPTPASMSPEGDKPVSTVVAPTTAGA